MKLTYENIWTRNFIIFCSTGILLAVASIFDPEAKRNDIPIQLISLGLTYLFLLVHNRFLVARYFLKGKIARYSVSAVLYAFAGAIALHSAASYFNEGENFPFISDFISTILLLVFGTGLYFLHLWIMDNIIASKKRILNTETELAMLKQQMNPHFLLNALNNLYGVALSCPEKIQDKILELSELLTYQIETGKKEWISVLDEIAFAEKYLRYVEWKTNGLKVIIQEEGEIKDYQITPLIFLPLLENAIKYSSELPAPRVSVSWVFTENQVEISIINSFKPTLTPVISTKTGIGNLQRRLELYHPDHQLTLFRGDSQFTAKLKLWNLTCAV